MWQSGKTDRVSPDLPVVSHGEGCFVCDKAGNRYLDGSGGPAVFSLGHSHPEVNNAIKAQLDLIAHGYRYSFTSDPLVRLTELIQAQAGAGSEHVLFVSSGSEAIESALKIALQYHWSNGDKQRTRFIARQRSYHGNTMGALSVSGFSQRRQQFEGALIPCSFVSSANDYRPVIEGSIDDQIDYLDNELQEAIDRLGAENVAAFIMEPVVGAAGGVVPAPRGYAKRMREVCDRNGILLIADEIMCGSGRCGTWRALEHDRVVADITAIGKGLGGGYIPIGAVLYTEAVQKPIFDSSGGINTGHTFTGHTLACAAAAKVQEIVVRDGLTDRVRERGRQFKDELARALGHLDAIGDIRGRGYFIGVECVADRTSKRPFDPSLNLTERIRERTLEAGLICYPVNGTVDGKNGDVAIISPPYNITDSELDELLNRFRKGLERALADIGAT